MCPRFDSWWHHFPLNMVNVKSAEFVISSPDVSMCPKTALPEYAFIGRSNVGKSSLINMLTQRKGLAKTSSTPGKTILINHFLINGEWHLVDLPGYGYAKRGAKERARLKEMIESYVLGREQLVNLFLLIDCRLEPQKIDLEFVEWLGVNAVPFSIVFTKADKVSKKRLAANVETFMNTLREHWEELPPHFVSSSETRMGRDEVLGYIEQINKDIKKDRN